MIEITLAMRQDEAIDFLDGYEAEGVTYKYKEKKGIKLYFETNADDLDKACKLAKAGIKSQSWGSILFFQVVPAK